MLPLVFQKRNLRLLRRLLMIQCCLFGENVLHCVAPRRSVSAEGMHSRAAIDGAQSMRVVFARSDRLRKPDNKNMQMLANIGYWMRVVLSGRHSALL
jgi:hypothetical protein